MYYSELDYELAVFNLMNRDGGEFREPGSGGAEGKMGKQ